MNELTLNLNSGTLQGQTIGYDISISKELSSLESKQHGYSINVIDGKVLSLFICFRSGYRGFDSFKGVCKINLDTYKFNNLTTLDEFIALLGSPTEQWNDGVEQCAIFSINDREIEVIWNVDGEVSLDYLAIE
ncbi:hypothetical protein L1286_13100 [Pseudoalteromonas sp. SMS1]|uniref:hypothetical protein n=1 Tax=Pseudoalteromonas sp. SMS1 TaxID=2908894 RepID=UPI001F3994B5|nr:hypothetical protein [Pseudoalteromonas sp. SMS1]MCF2858419.1 hypothetical protein [Pseudoalteromonas sp. SMS1]